MRHIGRINPTQPDSHQLYVDDKGIPRLVASANDRLVLEDIAKTKYPTYDWCIVGLTLLARKKL